MNKRVSLAKLASLVNAEVIGDGTVEIEGLAGIEAATEGDITFLAKESQSELLQKTGASAAIVPPGITEGHIPLLKVKSPYLASAIIHNFLLETPFIARGVHARAHVGEGCRLGEAVTVEALAVLGDNVTLGERVRICSGAYIGDNVEIGDDCVIHPNVTIESESVLGSRVIIHAGTVIGSDGYGYAQDERGCHVKRPQVGNVRIDDDVEIGANCCVDRAAFGVTWIKSGTKIDNLVQVAHNVVLGENCLLVANSAVSGSSKLGRNVVLGGKAGVSGHITLGDGVMVAGKAGVTRNQSAGAVVGGMPAIPFKQWTKAVAAYARMPEMRTELRRLTKEMEELKEMLSMKDCSKGED